MQDAYSFKLQNIPGMPVVSSTTIQMGDNSSGPPSACSLNPSAAWPQHLSLHPNWNPERNAIQAVWPNRGQLAASLTHLFLLTRPVDINIF